MLQRLNERIQGIIAWVVMIIIALTFTLFGVDYYMQSRQGSDVAVTINGEPLSKQAFEVNYRRIRQQRDSRLMSAAKDKLLKKQVLEDMITNRVAVQSASNDGFQVSKQQADAAILSIPQFQEDGQFSVQRYQQALSAAMFTPESFQNEVRQGMLLSQQRFALMGTAFALPNEINQFVKLYMQTRDYNYLIIPAQQFLKSVTVSPEEISTYYHQEKHDFIEPEKVSIDYVTLSMDSIKSQIHLSDADLQRYYEENQSNFLTPIRWKLERLLFAIPQGASLEEKNAIKQKALKAYEKLSQEPALFSEKMLEQDHQVAVVGQLFSAKSGVNTQKMSSGQVPAKANERALLWVTAGTTPYDKVLARLTSPGQISIPVKTVKGYEIFKLIRTKPAQLKPFAQVKQEIKTQLLAEIAQTRYAQALEELTDLSYQTPDSLNAVSQALKLPIKSTALFAKEAPNNPFLKNPLIVNAIFSHDVLDLGNNSEPLQLDNDSVLVLRIHQRIPAKQQALAVVKPAILKKLTQLKASRAAQRFGQQLITEASLPKQNELIMRHKLVWQPLKNVGRDSDPSNPLISDLAFNLPRVNQEAGRRLLNGDYVVVKLKGVHDGQYDVLDREQQASLVQQIEASYGVMDYNLYVNSLVTGAKIDRAPSA